MSHHIQAASHEHKSSIHNQLIAKFLERLHDTELWASHLPRVPRILILVAFIGFALVATSLSPLTPASDPLKFSMLALAILLILPALFASIFALRKWRYVSRVRKQIFDSLALRGDEQILDVGCGSGVLLIGAAQRLNRGKAIGIDIWAPHSGGGNFDLLMKNAKAEGVADKIDFRQADVRQMPFEDASFDVIVSSGALHHISRELPDHERAMKEMARVLKPGGKIILWDTSHMIAGYAARMKSEGITSNITETGSSPFMFEMSIMFGEKTA